MAMRLREQKLKEKEREVELLKKSVTSKTSDLSEE
jgi:hypothetical protein